MKLVQPKDRYVHHVYHEDGIDIIVTMLPGLANRVHLCRTTIHDGTYKRVKDVVQIGSEQIRWKEWEVTIFDPVYNQRM